MSAEVQTDCVARKCCSCLCRQLDNCGWDPYLGKTYMVIYDYGVMCYCVLAVFNNLGLSWAKF